MKLLRKFQKNIATSIAKDLLEEGMVWGDELEEYLKLNAKGFMVFENEEHYLEFENYFLDIIEKLISSKIQVRKNETVFITSTIKDAAKRSGVSEPALYKHLRSGRYSTLKNKINIEFEVLKPRLDMI